MTVDVTTLAKYEVFRALPLGTLQRLAPLGQEVDAVVGDWLVKAEERLDGIYVVVRGIVALLVPFRNQQLITFDILGPGRLVGIRQFFTREDKSPMGVLIIMPSTLVRFEARKLVGFLATDEKAASLVDAELLHIQRKRFDFLLRALAAEEVAFPTEESCPIGRPTRFLAHVNTESGEIRGMCQRSFACNLHQGQGCPMAGKPAREFQLISVSNENGKEGNTTQPLRSLEG